MPRQLFYAATLRLFWTTGKKIRNQKFCENKSIKEKTIWTNTYYNGRFQKWSSHSILTIFLVGILQNKWKFLGGSAMRWRSEDVLQKEDGFTADRRSSWRRQQKIRQIRQDFNNEEILTKNVEDNQKSCQILERVMIFWVKKLTVNKEESKQKICQIKHIKQVRQ